MNAPPRKRASQLVLPLVNRMIDRRFIRIFLVAFASAIAIQGFAQTIRGANGITVTLPVQVPIQVKLDTIIALFFQIPDTFINSVTNPDLRYYFRLTFSNIFTREINVHISYFIHTNT